LVTAQNANGIRLLLAVLPTLAQKVKVSFDKSLDFRHYKDYAYLISEHPTAALVELKTT
jgi:hypothetical protein